MYSSYIIARSASRMRCWMTCFAVMRGDAPEALRRRVRAHHQVLRNLRPVELEVDVVDERVLTLARLLLDPLELVDRSLARLVDEPLLEVGGDLDREDAELALVVEDHLGVAGGARCLLVRGEERVLERRDERARLDALLALDRANAFHDLLAHDLTYPSSIRLPRTIDSYGMSSSFSPTAIRSAPVGSGDNGAAKAVLALDLTCSANLDRVADRPRGSAPGGAARPLEARGGDIDRVVRVVGGEDLRHARAERVVDAFRVIDVDAQKRVGLSSSTASTSTPGAEHARPPG